MEAQSLPEKMLGAYLGLSTSLWNRRITITMPFNEALVCYYIKMARDRGQAQVTATWLCERTQIAKSQMNRILNGLEEKHILRRDRSAGDKRQVLLCLDPAGETLFLEEHDRSIRLVQKLQEKFGLQRSRELTDLLSSFVDMLRTLDLTELTQE